MTTRSRQAIAAAVSTKASAPASKSAPSVSTRIEGGRLASCSSPTPFCREMSFTPAIAASGASAEERHGAGPIGFRIGVALPDDADLEAFRADPPGPRSRKAGSAREIGDGGRNCVEARAEGIGQAADRDLRVEWLPLRRPIDELHRGLRRQKPAQPRRTDEGHIDASRGHQRQIAKELDRIAETVIVEHQHALRAMSRSPSSVSKRVPSASAERLSLKPARLVSLKPAFEVPERQHEAALASDSLAAAQRRGRVERCPEPPRNGRDFATPAPDPTAPWPGKALLAFARR